MARQRRENAIMSDCRRQLSPERRKVVALCTMVACMSSGPILLKSHPILMAVWIAVMLVALVTALVQLAKLNRSE